MRVATRQQSGLVEDVLRSQVPDRTNWRALLKGDAEVLDLVAIREQIFDACADGLRELQGRFGLQAIQPLPDAEVVEMKYPVEAYPKKIVSFNLDKDPVVEGTLLGIKGQYLIFDTGVINIASTRPTSWPCSSKKDLHMRTEQPRVIYLKDYQAPEYLIDETHLTSSCSRTTPWSMRNWSCVATRHAVPACRRWCSTVSRSNCCAPRWTISNCRQATTSSRPTA